MKKTTFILLSCVMLIAMTCYAAPATDNGVDITVSAPQLKNREIYLGQYLMGKLYSRDTIRIDKKGNGKLKRNGKFDEGMYVMYFSDSSLFDLLIGRDQHFTVKIDTTDIPASIKIEGKGETPDFFNYTLGLMDKQAKAKKLNEQKAASKDSAEIATIDAELELLNQAHIAAQANLEKKYPNSMTSLFLKGLRIPEYKTDSIANDSVEAVKRYQFYSRHYLDNLDLSDKRTYRTPYAINTVDNYLNKVLIQSYDSIIPLALEIVEKSRNTDETFKYMCSHILGYAVDSKIMGMDSLIVALADRYYSNGTAYWADSSLVENINTEVNKIRRCLVGKKGHNLQLADSLGNKTDLYSSGGEEITVLFFYEPSCGHCRTVTPQLVEAYEKYKDDPRIKVVAVYMLTDKKEWMDFVKKNGMESFCNLWDPDRSSFYWYWYDTSSTPQIYVLDKDNRIFAKRIDVKTLEMIAEHEL